MKLLIIEDDIFFQKFYAEKLTEKGFEVAVAGDGESGLEKAKSFLPDIILLDMIIPKQDGFAVLTALSGDERLKKIPVLVFSTLSQKDDEQKVEHLGAVGYVNKSYFDFDALLAKINSALKK